MVTDGGYGRAWSAESGAGYGGASATRDRMIDNSDRNAGSYNRNRAWFANHPGVSNLTQDQAPVLVHLGKDKMQQWLLVRIKNTTANVNLNDNDDGSDSDDDSQ